MVVGLDSPLTASLLDIREAICKVFCVAVKTILIPEARVWQLLVKSS